MSENLATDNPFAFKRAWGPTPRYPFVEKYVSPYKGLISVAGPCSVESAEQIHTVAKALKDSGVWMLRGGIFRAGTYPKNEFGWVKEELMIEFSRAASENGMGCLVEVIDYHPESFALINKYADAFQVGARQMQNYMLLKVLASQKRPVFLKRNMGATLDEFLGAAEYILREKKAEVILVERGSSTHMNHVRWDLSLSIIPAIKAISKIPVIVDASHGTGRRDLVEPMTLAGIAAGASGFLVEVHPNPEKSLSDADQAFPLNQLGSLINKIKNIHNYLNSFKKGDGA